MKIKACLLKQKGDVCDFLINNKFNIENPDVNIVPIVEKGIGKFDNIAQWDNIDMDDSKYLLFGWIKGDIVNINKTDIPPPYDELKIYGDAIIVMINNSSKLTNFTSQNFEEFYKYIIEGFDEIEKFDDDEEENELYYLDDEENEINIEEKNIYENENNATFATEICNSELSEDDYLSENEQL